MRDLLIMDRLLVGISDDKTREELLSTHDLTLNICRGMEAASLHMKALKSEEINKIKDMTKKKKKSGHDKYQPRSKNSPQCDDQKSVKKKFLFCLQIHVIKKEICPAWRKTCAACGERNHFKASRRCKRQSVNSLAEDYSCDSFESSTGTISTVTVSEDQLVHSVNPGNQLIFCEMEIDKGPVRMQVDCGATVFILSKHYLEELPIRPERVRLQMWNMPWASVKSRTPPLGRNTKWTLA